MKDLRDAIMVTDGDTFSKEDVYGKLELFEYQLNEIADVIEESGMEDFDHIESAFLPYDIRDVSNIMYVLKDLFSDKGLTLTLYEVNNIAVNEVEIMNEKELISMANFYVGRMQEDGDHQEFVFNVADAVDVLEKWENVVVEREEKIIL